MDGRHARRDEEPSNEEDVRILKKNLRRLKKKYSEVDMSISEIDQKIGFVETICKFWCLVPVENFTYLVICFH
jgi:prefoldin subunit 5